MHTGTQHDCRDEDTASVQPPQESLPKCKHIAHAVCRLVVGCPQLLAVGDTSSSARIVQAGQNLTHGA